MQSIERYGVVALCFLIVTMVAVWAWDDQSPQAEEEVARAAEAGMRTSGTRAGQREKNKAGAQTAVSSPSQARFAQRSESEPRSAKRRAGLRSKPEQVSAEPSSGAIIASRSNALTQEAMHARRQEEARIEAGSALAGLSLRESPVRHEMDLILVAVRRRDGEMLFNPSAETVLQEGDTLIALGHGENLGQLQARCASPR